ncbi:MAG: phenylalanine--tRNA ligase subunit alpha [Phycisphaerae bacterium]
MKPEEILAQALTDLGSVKSLTDLEAFRIRYLGTKGLLKQASDYLKQVPNELKRTYGQSLNTVKNQVQELFDQGKQKLDQAPAVAVGVDVTEPGRIATSAYRPGVAHIISQTINELSTIMERMGFAIVTGPEVEDEFHNFEALNIPPQHPARDPLDNFYLDRPAGAAPFMLRSQTSTVQIRVMETQPPPIRIISLGRVYRPDTVDATHMYMFHQMEGLVVDRHVTMKDLRSCIDQFVKAFFGPEANTRFRPSFFPFTEPSAECDIQFVLPDGSKKWIELGGCGMVDPNVLKAVNIDPEVYSGFAFGFGVERIAMRKYGIYDIRLLYENDLRFLRQFA